MRFSPSPLRVYEVYVERAAQRDLRRLPPEEFQRVVAVIRALAENPRPPGCRKLSGSENDWRLRIGDRRVLYEVDDSAQAVRVMRVRHRREAYR
ncbi:MAG: type II toxin-antitoxin system RelE/ParE family toxin [Chloroflexi bacterium]|nr:type II toxin-antitoxin system RelE/ParE family toxin [Chloroflexota bacterium]